MYKKVTVKMWLSLPFLVISFAFGCGSTMIAPNVESASPTLINEGTSSQPVGRSGVSMRVLWTVSKYTPGKNALWGDKEARAMLFKPLDITATAITFDGKTCRGVVFKQETLNTKEYLNAAFHTDPRTLGIAEESVEVFKTNCDLPGFAEYLRLKDRRLVIHLNGIFFFLEPAITY